MDPSNTEFEVELETLAAHLVEWLDAGYEGMWIAIRGSRFAVPCRQFADAWEAGVTALGADGLIVERIERACTPLRF